MLFIVGTDLFVVPPLLPLIAETYTVTPTMAGRMVMVFSLMYAVGAPVFGLLADRWGRRELIMIGLGAFAGANLLSSTAPGFGWLLVSREVAGLATAAITPSVYAMISDVAPAVRRGTWLSIVGSGFLTGLWAGAPLGTLAAHIAGWTSVFVSLAGAAGLLVLANGQLWPPALPASRDASWPRLTPFNLLAAASTTICWGAAIYGFYTYLGTALREQLHLSPEAIAGVLTVYGSGAVLGSVSGGRLADRWGAQQVAKVSLTWLAGILILLGLLLANKLWFFVCLGVLAFVGYAFSPANQARLAQDFPTQRGTFLAWNNSALYVGIALGAALGGWVITEWGFGRLPYLCAVIALLGSRLSARSLRCMPSDINTSPAAPGSPKPNGKTN